MPDSDLRRLPIADNRLSLLTGVEDELLSPLSLALEGLIRDFSIERALIWLRMKFDSLDTSMETKIATGVTSNEKNYIEEARLLGCIRTLPDGEANAPVLVVAVKMTGELVERSSRSVQLGFAKRILKNSVGGGGKEFVQDLEGLASQGLFFFYDEDGYFRLSFVTGTVSGRKMTFSDAKRQSFYINPEKSNNIVRRRMAPQIRSLSDLKAAFSVEALTKEFYLELFNWYCWAINSSTGLSFPNDLATHEDDREHLAENVIRLITRLMFTWFIRQRNLVPDDLFMATSVGKILKNFESSSLEQDNYYRVILQNLFFATYNCSATKRQFAKNSTLDCPHPEDEWIKTLYRYKEELSDPQLFLDRMASVPFLNCSLFDCLDKIEREQDGGRILLCDGFSNMPERQAHIPNALFFDQKKGLIRILDAYEFTIDENLSNDADIALDPELLGKVFENLLGVFNPETQQTARKSTGSFYTPREIVDYMVDEALADYLRQQIPSLTEKEISDLFSRDRASAGDRLEMGKESIAKVQDALYACRILDPACGSGAFPMGVLHCMVRLFSRLDPSNNDIKTRLIGRYREEKQTSEPNPNETMEERKAALEQQLEEGQHYPDYARKLYLIENCIYGVDIQPIATQIAKLRFFISLLCDQLRMKNTDGTKGVILSLPNLEAKFVCADTLVALPLEASGMNLETPAVARLREELQLNRHRIFRARSVAIKDGLKEKDMEIRDKIRSAVKSSIASPDEALIQCCEKQIALFKKERAKVAKPKLVQKARPVRTSLLNEESIAEQSSAMIDANKEHRDYIDTEIAKLEACIASEKTKGGLDAAPAADKLAVLVSSWDPYDQNAISPFFDARWMFNLEQGFDVIVGNPPFVQLHSNEGMYARKYQNCGFKSFVKTADLYCLFTERGMNLLKSGGVLSFIMPNKWLITDYGLPLRKFLDSRRLIALLNFGDVQFFESAANCVCILSCMNAKPTESCRVLSVNKKIWGDDFISSVKKHLMLDYATEILRGKRWIVMHPRHASALKKMQDKANTDLKGMDLKIYRGILTGYNAAFYIDASKRQELINKDASSADIIVPQLRGRDMKAYLAPEPEEWLINTHNGYRKIPSVDVNLYPAVKIHLDGFKGRLERRSDRGKTPYNLRNCAYLEDFSKPKLMYPNMTSRFPFCYDETGAFVNQKGFIMIGDTELLKWLCGLFNSRLTKLWIWYNCPELQGGTREISKVYFEQIPICFPAEEEKRRPLIDAVEAIIEKKKVDLAADTTDLENSVDEYVYALYGLDEEEANAVETLIIQEIEENKGSKARRRKRKPIVQKDAGQRVKVFDDEDDDLLD